jgi:hypothetical protein
LSRQIILIITTFCKLEVPLCAWEIPEKLAYMSDCRHVSIKNLSLSTNPSTDLCGSPKLLHFPQEHSLWSLVCLDSCKWFTLCLVYKECSERTLIGQWLIRVIKIQNRAQEKLLITPNEWPLCREISASADKMFRTYNKPTKWTSYIYRLMLVLMSENREIGTSSNDWAQLGWVFTWGRKHGPFPETLFWIKNMPTDNIQKVSNYIFVYIHFSKGGWNC